MIADKTKTVEAYRARLLRTLLAEDVKRLLVSMHLPHNGGATDNNYNLLRVWNGDIEDKVIGTIKEKLHQ